MRLKRVEAQNFLSYRNLIVDFEKYKDRFVLIEGKVSDKQKTDSNGSGKSAIIESVVYGLFGETIRNTRYADDVINSQIKKDCKVVVKFGDYVVERYRKHGKHKNSLFFMRMRCDGSDIVDLRGKSDTETQDRIDQALGMDCSCFIGSHIFSGNSNKFTTISDSERKEILRSLSNAEWVEKCLERVKSEQSKNQEILRLGQLDLSKVDGVIEGLDSCVEDTKKKLELLKKNHKESVLSLDEFQSKNKDFVINKKLEVSCIEKKIQSQNDLLVEHLEVINKHKFDIEKSNKIEEDINSKSLEIEEYNSCLKVNKNKILEAKDQIKTYSLACDDIKLELKKVSKELANIPVPDQKAIIEIDRERSLLIDSLSKDIFDGVLEKSNNINVSIGVINSDIDKDNKQILKYSSNIDTYCHSCKQEISESHIDKLKSEVKKHLSDLKRNLKRSLSHKSKIEGNLKVCEEIKANILKLDKKKIDIQKNNDSLKISILKKESLIKSLQQKIDVNIVKIDSIEQQIEQYRNIILSDSEKISCSKLFIEKLQKEKNLIGVIKDVIVRCRDLEGEVKHIKSVIIPDYMKDIRKIEDSIKLFEENLLELKNNMKSIFEKLNSAEIDYSVLKGKLENSIKSLKGIKVKNDVAIENGRKLDIVSKIFGKGGIQNHIFNLIIPEFKNKVNYFVSQLADDIAVDVSTQLEQKKNVVNKINFNPYITRGGGSGYSSISSGQKRKVDIAATMAIKSLYSVFGKGLGFSFYDEILDNLDSTGVIQVVDMLKRDVGTRFLITHNNDIKSEFDDVMTVQMSKNISEVK